MKVGDYEIVIKKGEEELEQIPDDLPVYDFEGNTVTLKEAKEGYMRTSDYTKKTQAVAEMRKFLTDDLGFQDDRQGVATMKRVLDTLTELQDKGILDPVTGEIKMPASKKSNEYDLDDLDDLTGKMKVTLADLPPEVQSTISGLGELKKDIGGLMGYISRKEMRDQFPHFEEEEIEMAHKLAAIDPSKSPLEHAKRYDNKREEWSQKAVDSYVEELKKPKEEGHARDASQPGAAALEIFGDEPVFSFNPDEHEGKNVVDPSKAANEYMEKVIEEMRKG